ncbi:MAG: 30S ribosome-binding factor RbfA [Alphaproteobacteria bacterium]|jgi:ribosome-binding factor A
MKNRSKSAKNAGAQPPGQRQLRVGERIRHILSDVMRHGGLRDPDLQNTSVITVTAVDIGPDLQNAVAYVMPLGGENADAIVAALNRAAGFFRSEMAAQLDLRYTPKVTFKIDRSFDEAAHIDKLLGRYEVRKDTGQDEKGAGTDDDNETA